MENERDWRRALEQTWVVRFPKQHLATFGSTNLAYYVVTEPIYKYLDPNQKDEGVVRTGRVIAQKPSVITPTYALSLQGFSTDAYEYLEHLAQKYGPNSPGILYQYKNETEKTDIVGGVPNEIAHRISDDLDGRNDKMSVVMVGVDELWDVALLNFIYEFTSSSAAQNVQEFQAKGLLEPEPASGGLPQAAVRQIERLFHEVQQGGDPGILKRELDRWGVFEYYEDRFLGLFRRKRPF